MIASTSVAFMTMLLTLRVNWFAVLAGRLEACDDVLPWLPEEARTWWRESKTAGSGWSERKAVTSRLLEHSVRREGTEFAFDSKDSISGSV